MRQPLFYGWVIVAAAFVTSLIGYGVEHSFSVFLKPLSQYFDWSRAATAGAFLAFTIGRGLYGITLGVLIDRYGPRLVVGIGALLMASGMMLSAAIAEVWHLYLIYAIFIAGGVAASWIPLAATIARWFHARRGLAIGLVNAGAGVGIVAMPPLAGVLISFQSVRAAYIEVGAVVLVLALLVALLFRGNPEEMGLKPYGFASISQRGTSTLGVTTSLTMRQAWHTSAFWILAIIVFMYVLNLFTVLVNIVAHATDLGISPLTAPTILSFVGGSFILGALLAGPAGDRFGYKGLLMLVLLTQAASSLWLTFVSSYALFCLYGVIVGLCYGGGRVILTWVTADYFGPRAMGTIFGTIVAISMVGGALGSFTGNLIYEYMEPHSYRLAFWIGGGAQLASVALFPFLKKPRP